MTAGDQLKFIIEGKEGGVYIREDRREKRHDELDVEQPVGRGEGKEEEGVAGMGLGRCDLIDGGRETP